MTARTGWNGSVSRFWLARFAAACTALGLLLTPGFNSFETPPRESLISLAYSGHIGLDPEHPRVPTYSSGVDGRLYSDHEIGSLVVAAPFAFAAKYVAGRTGFPYRLVLELILSFASAAIFGATAVILVLLGERLRLPREFTAVRLLVLIVASQYLVYALVPVDVSLSATLLALTVLLWKMADGGGGSWALVGLSSGFLVAVKLTNATVPLALLCATLMSTTFEWKDRLKRTPPS